MRIKRYLERLLGGRLAFRNSQDYWRERYRKGGNSGAGSYRHLAEFKAEILNRFVRERQVAHVIEFGSGDGNQLRYAKYPKYTGFDISEDALKKCREVFDRDLTKCFLSLNEFNPVVHTADLVISLDVIFHLVEDEIFENYMRRLFSASLRFVIIYSSNTDGDLGVMAAHVRHRQFTNWIASHEPEWRLTSVIKNRYPYDGNHELTSFADFFLFERISGA